jgi:hypothetical protein
LPQGYDRLADAFPRAALDQRLDEFKNRIQTNVDAMSDHGAFIDHYCRSEEAAAPAAVPV